MKNKQSSSRMVQAKRWQQLNNGHRLFITRRMTGLR